MSDQRIHFKQYSMANSLNASNSLYSFISRVKDRFGIFGKNLLITLTSHISSHSDFCLHSPALSGTSPLHWASLTVSKCILCGFPRQPSLGPCHTRSRKQQLSSSLPILAFPAAKRKSEPTLFFLFLFFFLKISQKLGKHWSLSRWSNAGSRFNQFVPFTFNETLMSNKCGYLQSGGGEE